MKEAQGLYAKFRDQYDVTLDSVAVFDAYRKHDKNRDVSIRAWTIQELRALDEALGYFAPLLKDHKERAFYSAPRVGPKHIGRLEFTVRQSAELMGKTYQMEDIALFGAIHKDEFGAVGTMVHELAHSIFNQLETEFLHKTPQQPLGGVPYWIDATRHVDMEMSSIPQRACSGPVSTYATERVSDDVAVGEWYFLADKKQACRAVPTSGRCRRNATTSFSVRMPELHPQCRQDLACRHPSRRRWGRLRLAGLC